LQHLVKNPAVGLTIVGRQSMTASSRRLISVSEQQDKTPISHTGSDVLSSLFVDHLFSPSHFVSLCAFPTHAS
jgi:hypothetical protein